MLLSLTWIHLVGHHALGPVGDVCEGPQRSVERLHLLQWDVQHRVSGGIVQVDLLQPAVIIDPVQQVEKRVFFINQIVNNKGCNELREAPLCDAKFLSLKERK